MLEPLYPDLLGENFLAAVLPGADQGYFGTDFPADLADPATPTILGKLFDLPGTGRAVPGPGTETVWPRPLAGTVMTELIEAARRWDHVARYTLEAISTEPVPSPVRGQCHAGTAAQSARG